jgi:hypothetical protein
MPNRASRSLLYLCTLAVAGCGAASGLGAGGASGGATTTTSSATSTGASGGATGTTTSTTTSSGAVFSPCARGMLAPAPGNPLAGMAFDPSGTLTLTPQGSALSVAYDDQYGAHDTFLFDPSTATTAALAPGGAVADGYSAICAFGPGEAGGGPATLTATTGTLDDVSGTLFLTLAGTAAGSPGGACTVGPVPGNAWFICGGAGPSTLPDAGPPAPPDAGGPDLLAGTYTCSSQLTTYAMMDGEKAIAGSGANGTLTVTQSGLAVTAAYTGDNFISGTVDFSLVTATSAHTVPGQTLQTSCEASFVMGPPPPDPAATLSIAAGSLVLDGQTLLLMYSGSMTSTPSQPTMCPGALKMGTLICTKA